MSARQPVGRMSHAEYVAAEATADVRHEYLRGQIFAMAGGTLEHAALASALARDVGSALQGKPCRVFSADARVRVAATDMTTYPDLSVVCGELQRAEGDDRAMLNPVVVFEVLSDSTEAYDRGAKASHYRHIPSLKEYVLVSQNEPRIEVQRRNASGHWEIHEFGPGQHALLESLGVSLSLDDLYRNPLASLAGVKT
jgi:Uma2 family endonuclease